MQIPHTYRKGFKVSSKKPEKCREISNTGTSQTTQTEVMTQIKGCCNYNIRSYKTLWTFIYVWTLFEPSPSIQVS